MTVHQALLALADHDLTALADALRANRLAPPFTPVSLQRVLPPNLAVGVAGDLLRLCTAEGFVPAQLATVVDMVARDRRARGQLQDHVDLVTSGPEAAGITNRDTSVVVRELFAHARASVLVGGYAVYQGQAVFRALADRMQERPDLKIRLLLDVKRGPGDTSPAAEVVRRFREDFQARQWPANRPIPDEVFYYPRSVEPGPDGKWASLHAKCVVVDGDTSFVSSANFTEAGQERNVEVGLLIRSRSLAGRLTLHFERLVDEQILVPVGKFCRGVL